MSKFNAHQEHIGTDKSVSLLQSAKLTIVLSELIITDSSVQVTLMSVLKELNGQEATVKQSKRNVKLACIGRVVPV